MVIALRVWYLTTIKHDEHLNLSKKPRRHTLVDLSNRGTIRDRFNRPLAINKIQYRVGITYDPLRRLPRNKWTKDKTRIPYRKNYIHRLSNFLAQELDIDPVWIEDTIHSRASIFPNTFFTLKEKVDEKTFYRLKMQERLWPGLKTEVSAERFYPEEKLACHTLGYLGSISHVEHLRIKQELSTLKEFIRDRENGLPVPLPKGFDSSMDVRARLQELQERSYTINSRVGKTGVEGSFDEDLRGFSGRQKYEIDIQGNYVRLLPDSYPPTPGRRVLLTLSSELQSYAEKLLIESEETREKRFAKAGRGHDSIASPWIKGGAIVAMVPSTGEIVAMASYPRFNPNHFSNPTSEKAQIQTWLETPQHLGEIWDGLKPLTREMPEKSRVLTSTRLTWDHYLDRVLSKESTLRQALSKHSTVNEAVSLQRAFAKLLRIAPTLKPAELIEAVFPSSSLSESTPMIDPLDVPNIVKEILGPVKFHEDKLLLLDLFKLATPALEMDEQLFDVVGEESIDLFRQHNQNFCQIQEVVKGFIFEMFSRKDFPLWREKYFKGHLEEKRREEKKAKKIQRPYIEHLEEAKLVLATEFFERYRLEFLKTFITRNAPFKLDHPLFHYFDALVAESYRLEKEISLMEARSILQDRLRSMPEEIHYEYLRLFRTYREMTRPLYRKYPFSKKREGTPLEQDLIAHFYPPGGFGFTKSYAHQETAPIGSIFKTVTGYAALKDHLKKAPDDPSIPFKIVDVSPRDVRIASDRILGYMEDGTPITRVFKGGRLPRSHKSIGKVDFLKAMESSSNIFFSLMASECLDTPKNLLTAAQEFGLGRKTGIELSGEKRGHIPEDVEQNKTGLYALAIGQHSLTVTPLQVAEMLSGFANRGIVIKPHLLKLIAGIEPTKNGIPLGQHHRYAYQDYLNLVGIYFPLFSESQGLTEKTYLVDKSPEIAQILDMPKAGFNYLLSGMNLVINGENAPGRPMMIRTLYEQPAKKGTYHKVRQGLIGKTSTAEILYRPCLDKEYNPILCKHIWFTGISYPEVFDPEKEPDLLVVVYLRYGDHGKEAIPIASELIQKWREIQAKASLELQDSCKEVNKSA